MQKRDITLCFLSVLSHKAKKYCGGLLCLIILWPLKIPGIANGRITNLVGKISITSPKNFVGVPFSVLQMWVIPVKPSTNKELTDDSERKSVLRKKINHCNTAFLKHRLIKCYQPTLLSANIKFVHQRNYWKKFEGILKFPAIGRKSRLS